eukprot:scaffold2059_cov342-Prasinococcus_capsulatus_cf.AAC.11
MHTSLLLHTNACTPRSSTVLAVARAGGMLRHAPPPPSLPPNLPSSPRASARGRELSAECC